MKNKILKTSLIILVVLLILFGLNFFRNYKILKEIYNETDGFLENATNLYTKVIHKIGDNYIQEYEILYKDGKYNYKFSQNGKMLTLMWGNLNTQEFIEYELADDGTYQKREPVFSENPNLEDGDFKLLFEEATFEEAIKSNIFRYINTINDCYVINLRGDRKIVNKDTGFVVHTVSMLKELQIYQYSSYMLEGIVKDEDVEKPNL